MRRLLFSAAVVVFVVWAVSVSATAIPLGASGLSSSNVEAASVKKIGYWRRQYRRYGSPVPYTYYPPAYGYYPPPPGYAYDPPAYGSYAPPPAANGDYSPEEGNYADYPPPNGDYGDTPADGY
jgi:hypothetical protein